MKIRRHEQQKGSVIGIQKKTPESPIRGIVRSKKGAESAITGSISRIKLPNHENIAKCNEKARKIRLHS